MNARTKAHMKKIGRNIRLSISFRCKVRYNNEEHIASCNTIEYHRLASRFQDKPITKKFRKISLKNVLTNVNAFDTMTPTNVITNVKTHFTRIIRSDTTPSSAD